MSFSKLNRFANKLCSLKGSYLNILKTHSFCLKRFSVGMSVGNIELQQFSRNWNTTTENIFSNCLRCLINIFSLRKRKSKEKRKARKFIIIAFFLFFIIRLTRESFFLRLWNYFISSLSTTQMKEKNFYVPSKVVSFVAAKLEKKAYRGKRGENIHFPKISFFTRARLLFCPGRNGRAKMCERNNFGSAFCLFISSRDGNFSLLSRRLLARFEALKCRLTKLSLLCSMLRGWANDATRMSFPRLQKTVYISSWLWN